MKQEESGHGTSSMFLSFLIGSLVGAGVALLFAPRSGKETRQKIREIAEDVKGKAEGYVEEWKGKVTSAVDRGKDFLEEKKTMITTAVEAGKEAYEKEKEKQVKRQ